MKEIVLDFCRNCLGRVSKTIFYIFRLKVLETIFWEKYNETIFSGKRTHFFQTPIKLITAELPTLYSTALGEYFEAVFRGEESFLMIFDFFGSFLFCFFLSFCFLLAFSVFFLFDVFLKSLVFLCFFLFFFIFFQFSVFLSFPGLFPFSFRIFWLFLFFCFFLFFFVSHSFGFFDSLFFSVFFLFCWFFLALSLGQWAEKLFGIKENNSSAN